MADNGDGGGSNGSDIEVDRDSEDHHIENLRSKNELVKVHDQAIRDELDN